MVKNVHLKGLQIHCEADGGGNFSYRGDFPFEGQDHLNADNGFFLKEPAFGNGTQKVRGHATDVGGAFRGFVKVQGDFIVDDEDHGDCSSDIVPWKAK